MKQYTTIRGMMQGVVAATCFLLFAALSLFPFFYELITEGVFYPGALGCGFVGLLFAGGVCWLLMNMYPSIWVSSEGLFISHNLLWRIFIPWEDIEEIRSPILPWVGTLVSARAITPLHRLYGWQWGWTIQPSFLVDCWMSGQDELLREIRRRSHLSEWGGQ